MTPRFFVYLHKGDRKLWRECRARDLALHLPGSRPVRRLGMS